MSPQGVQCRHCHDHVKPLHYCPECGLYDPNEEDY